MLYFYTVLSHFILLFTSVTFRLKRKDFGRPLPTFLATHVHPAYPHLLIAALSTSLPTNDESNKPPDEIRAEYGVFFPNR